MAWKATLADLFTFGLPGGVAVPEARMIASVDTSTSTLELPGHALFGGERVRFRAASVGATLPTGTAAGMRYLVATPTDPDFFTITTTGGAPVTISTTGSGSIALLVDITPKLSAMLDARTSYVVAHAKAYGPPWTTPPAWAPMVVAHLVAYDAASVLRVTTPQFSLEELAKRAALAEAFLVKLDKGEPYNDGTGPIDATPVVAEMGSRIVELDGRGFTNEPEDARV